MHKICHLISRVQPNEDVRSTNSSIANRSKGHLVLCKTGPLFKILNKDQVGMYPLSGRPQIAPEVLQEMHNYLLAIMVKIGELKSNKLLLQ